MRLGSGVTGKGGQVLKDKLVGKIRVVYFSVPPQVFQRFVAFVQKCHFSQVYVALDTLGDTCVTKRVC